MDELAKWLCAQLDGDERAIIYYRDGHPGVPCDNLDDYDSCSHHIAAAEATPYRDAEFGLREIEAKRLILAAYERYAAERRRMMNGWESSREVSPILIALALPYSDRPGYREEWRP